MIRSAALTFIDQIEALPPLPQIVPKLLSVTANPNATCEQVAATLNQDPAVAAKILRVANSSFYGAQREIAQLERAVIRLGTVTVRNLVVGMCAREAVSAWALRPAHQVSLWRHALATAAACDLIARHVGTRPAEEALVAGLLHDIGQLAMAAHTPDRFDSIVGCQGQTAGFLSLEVERFGIDHTEAGRRMLKRWGLPESFCRIVRDHHQPDLGEEHGELLAVVVMGDIFAQLLGLGMDFMVTASARGTAAAERLGLSRTDQLQILGQVEQHMERTEQILGKGAGSRPTIDSSPNRVLWVSHHGADGLGFGQLLLEHAGYEIAAVSPESIAACEAEGNPLVIIDGSHGAAEAMRLAAALGERGYLRVAVVAPLEKGQAIRYRDPETGACRIPSTFGAFDLCWVEQELKS